MHNFESQTFYLCGTPPNREIEVPLVDRMMVGAIVRMLNLRGGAWSATS